MTKIYPLFLFVIFSFCSLQAQELYIKGSVTVQPNGLIYVAGDVQIDAGGGVLDIQSSGANHGKVQVQVPAVASPGSWTCNGTTSSTVGGEGEVEFLGPDVDYDVQGSSVTFPNLIVNTSFLIGGVNVAKFMVHDNITISRSLDLSNGRIVTDGVKEVYISNSASNAIKSSGGGLGANYSNYIEGSLRREIVLGNYYKFPVGCTPDATPGATNNKGYNLATVDLRGPDARKPANCTNILAKFIYSADPGTM